MDKIETRIIKKEERKHIFICDLCKKILENLLNVKMVITKKKADINRVVMLMKKAGID